MRNQWRLLLRHHRSSIFLSAPKPIHILHHQVTSTPSSSSRNFSSCLPQDTSFYPALKSHSQLRLLRHFSADPSTSANSSDQSVLLVGIFSKRINDDKIRKELESSNVVISRDLVLNVLGNLKSNPNTAIKFFDWVLERDGQRLSSKSYNLMLKILGSNGFVTEFWDMVGAMMKKGYGVSKGTFIEVSKKFEDDGLQADLEKLKGLFSKELDVSATSCRIASLVRKEAWDDVVEKELMELGVSYSSELVKMVLEKLSTEPMKGLIFFRWIEESCFFEHNGATFNAMAVVLGREDCLDRFWNVVGEMENAGHEMERETYVKVLGRFMNRKMLKDAVALYEFAMNGMSKLPKEECTFLLRKIVVARELDIDLFSRVVKVFTEEGFALEDSMLDAVLKSLTTVGRMTEYSKVLQAMLECGFRPSGTMQGRVAFDLSSSKMQDEADEFVQKLEACGLVPVSKMWAALIEGHCVAGNVDKAQDCLQMMIDREGVSSAGYPVDILVNAYCNRNRASQAYKVLADFVNREGLKPCHMTYKLLLGKLLVQGSFHDALNMLGLMKNHGFPPFLDPFIAYLSRKGTADEAMLFLQGMTVNSYPSTSVFLRVFEAFSKAERPTEAQDLLAKCPQYVRNNADVLNFFYSMKSGKPVEQAAMAA